MPIVADAPPNVPYTKLTFCEPSLKITWASTSGWLPATSIPCQDTVKVRCGPHRPQEDALRKAVTRVGGVERQVVPVGQDDGVPEGGGGQLSTEKVGTVPTLRRYKPGPVAAPALPAVSATTAAAAPNGTSVRRRQPPSLKMTLIWTPLTRRSGRNRIREPRVRRGASANLSRHGALPLR